MNHPLHLLDDFLSSLPPLNAHGNALFEDGMLARRQDLVLRVADELLGYDHRSGIGGGGTGSGPGPGCDRGGTLLENALALLDDKRSRGAQSHIISGNDGPATIRRIRAKRSGREAILFRKQRGSKIMMTSSTSAELPLASSGTIMTDEYYLCLIPRLRNWPGVGGNGSGSIRGAGAHCTCRSFLHNIISAGGHGGRRNCRQMTVSSSLNTVVTCKHVLAAKLMPHLLLSSSDDNNLEIVDDRLFARLLTRASIG